MATLFTQAFYLLNRGIPGNFLLEFYWSVMQYLLTFDKDLTDLANHWLGTR